MTKTTSTPTAKPTLPSLTVASSRCAGLVFLGVALSLTGATLVGCQSNDPNRSGIFQPYRVDIPQGNYVTKEMLALVKPGMSQQQVKFALGAPLLTPVFNADRWDYVFRHQFINGTSDLKRVVIRFKDGKVGTIEADELPGQAAPTGPAPSTPNK
jgi:outer membrane protein assembly factor BamE